jgi:glucose dehydrogenase
MPNKPFLRSILLFMIANLLASGVCRGQSGTGWPVYNGGPDGDHYSRLTQINRANVKRLTMAWTFDTGEKGGMQDNPLIVGRTLYGYTPTQKIVALDAATGKLKWKFDSGIKGTQPARGMAYWTDGHHGRIFAGVMNFLYCLDAATGKPIASFGESGRIDLRKELRGNYEHQSIVLTTPGIIYKDLIIVGGRNPETHPAPPGDVRAFDVRTGKLRWSFHTIPHPGEPGYETWPPEAWKTAGAANNWAGMALDAKRGIVYAPTGSAVFDFYGGDRLGDDLYANTILALDANTGKRLWHFQGVHHDIWDRDFPSHPALFTLRREGKPIEALAQTTKQGYLYLFNRITGQPLFPIHEHPCPASTVPGEVTSLTQPAPDAPEPFARQRLTEEMLTTRTPEAHAWAVKEFRTFASDGQFIPFAVGRQTIIFPGFDGGAEWGGPAIDPATNILYVNATEMAWTGGLVPATHGGAPGAQVYQNQCGVCHGLDRAGAPPAFPSLVDVGKRLSGEKITEAIRQGTGRMPSFPNIDEARLAALLDYLRTDAQPAAPGAPAKELASVPALAAAAQPAANPAGAAAYRDRCAVCHGDHLEGVPPSFPMLAGLGSRLSEAQTVAIIQKGRGNMAAIPDLQGPELAALLRYLGVGSGATPPGPASEYELEKYTFTGYRKFLDPDGYPAIAPPWGTLNAIDIETGKYLWKIPFGEYPDLVRQGIANTGSESYGGPIVTAGGVLFIAATVYDRKFRAFDSRTGKLLWQTELPFAGVATPSTYLIDGRQYIVIAASGGRDPKSPVGGAYVAFSLPRRARSPAGPSAKGRK